MSSSTEAGPEPAETQSRLKQVLPQVEIVTIPGLGHYPVDEDPPGFLEGGRLKFRTH